MSQSPSLDPTTVRRLAFVKYLYKTGVSQSEAPEPLGGASLLTFHDSVELFNYLAAEHLNTNKNPPNFMDYWDLISNKLPTGVVLSQKVSMQRLNKARVALKHHGTLPSKLDLEAFRASVTNFFQDNTQIVFGLSFDNISLIDFVQPDEAKEKLKIAEEHLSRGEIENAMDNVAIAFEMMLDDYEGRKIGKSIRSPLLPGGDLSGLRSLTAYGRRDGNTNMLNVIIRSLEAMQQDIKMLALGFDYRRYTKFKMYAPFVFRTFNGPYEVERNRPSNIIPATSDDARFCMEFVIEAAVSLKEFDYDVKGYGSAT